MTKKSNSRLARDAQQARAMSAQKEAARGAAQEADKDPLEKMRREELARLSQVEEEKALSGNNSELWSDLEKLYTKSNQGLAGIGIKVAQELSDANIRMHIVDQGQFTDRVRILENDIKTLKSELDAIHDLHAHRGDDKTSPRETFAGIEIAEHYAAWQAKMEGILERTITELGAMYDEGRRILMKKMADAEAAKTAELEAQGISTVEATETKEAVPPLPRGMNSPIFQIDEAAWKNSNQSAVGIDPGAGEDKTSIAIVTTNEQGELVHTVITQE